MGKKIQWILIGLTLLDFLLASVCLLSPSRWTQIMHGTDFVDSLGLIRRLGAVWAAFFLFQAIALFRWQKDPYWLVLVAGIRFTEIFSDWIYLGFSESLTIFGKLGLFVSPPVNILVGWYFLRCFLRMQRTGH